MKKETTSHRMFITSSNLPQHIKTLLTSPLHPHTHVIQAAKRRQSYLKLLQLLFDHLHLRSNHALCIQTLFRPSQQALQLSHKPVELPNPVGSILGLVQPGLAALVQLENKEYK